MTMTMTSDEDEFLAMMRRRIAGEEGPPGALLAFAERLGAARMARLNQRMMREAGLDEMTMTLPDGTTLTVYREDS
jgi:hypothetical protein